MTFRTRDPNFAQFLWQEAKSSFPARNFLLDESIAPPRADSYLVSQAQSLNRNRVVGLRSRGDWKATHEDYLQSRVFLEQQVGAALPEYLDPADVQSCPETFRYQYASSGFGGADPGLHLLRLVDLRSLLDKARVAIGRGAPSAEEAFDATSRCAQAWPEPHKADEQDRILIEGIFSAWNQKADYRPTFVGFFAEHDELFKDSFSGNWANELRDRLGLCHFGPQKMLLFRYPIGKIPQLKGWRLARPLTIPTVLDGRQSEAFCPAPASEDCGRLLHLRALDVEPAREVLHPYLDLQLEHLFKAGEISEPPPPDLSEARRSHLNRLRNHHGHTSFALDTDP